MALQTNTVNIDAYPETFDASETIYTAKVKNASYIRFNSIGEVNNYNFPSFTNETDLSNLVEVELAEGVTQLDNGAFACATNLTSVTLPASLVDIPNNLFYNCESLRKVVIKGATHNFSVENAIINIGDGGGYDVSPDADPRIHAMFNCDTFMYPEYVNPPTFQHNLPATLSVTFTDMAIADIAQLVTEHMVFYSNVDDTVTPKATIIDKTGTAYHLTCDLETYAFSPVEGGYVA